MKQSVKTELRRLACQILIWCAITFLPALLMFAVTKNLPNARMLLESEWYLIRNYCIIYFVNYCLLVPFVLNRKKKVWFWVLNLLLIALLNIGLFHVDFRATGLHGKALFSYAAGVLLYIFLMFLSVLAASAMWYYYRGLDLKDRLTAEKQKHTEAELAWLKSQINPHFLFNTLNNISGLVKVDADKAQDSIAQLSDLMRYAVYETDQPAVPVDREVEFLTNYIDLMRLRVNEKCRVETDFRIEYKTNVAPLLFISPIENAFKHGVSSNRPSFISIALSSREDGIRFTCSNTNYPKDDLNRSGSGIGLPNLERRLALIYPDRYTYHQGLSHDESLDADVWNVEITIRP